jgi:hypothetical protein
MNISSTEINSPVLFLVFNRIETTKQVFDAIKRARPNKLYIAADGARAHRAGEAESVAEVRKIAADVDWPCTVKTLFRNENLGCKKAVSSAISWFFENEAEGIIIEDDVLPSIDFFKFCDYALNQYRNDTRFGMITGTNLLGAEIESNQYVYSQSSSIWGWATWRRAWDLYDPELKKWPDKWLKDSIRNRFKSEYANYLENTFNSYIKYKIDTWDIQWLYTCVFNNFLCITPRANMISNIGVVGTHSSVQMPNHFVQFGKVPQGDFVGPKEMVPDPYFDAALVRKIFRQALWIQRLSRVAKILKVNSLLKRLYILIYKLK